MTREQKMQAVVDAARASVARWRDFSDNELSDSTVNLREALAALDAHTEADAETMTLAVWEWPTDGDIRLCRVDSEDPPMPPWTRLGTVRLPLDRERGE